MSLKKRLQNMVNYIFYAFKEVKNHKKFILIEHIDIDLQQVVLHCKTSNTVLKLSFLEVIKDAYIISRLYPTQACWLGYYSGLTQSKAQVWAKNNNTFCLRSKEGTFQIVSRERDGRITYVNRKNNNIYCEPPLLMAKNEGLVKNFDPSQACYIGILAGIEQKKEGKSHGILAHEKPYLRLIVSQ